MEDNKKEGQEPPKFPPLFSSVIIQFFHLSSDGCQFVADTRWRHIESPCHAHQSHALSAQLYNGAFVVREVALRQVSFKPWAAEVEFQRPASSFRFARQLERRFDDAVPHGRDASRASGQSDADPHLLVSGEDFYARQFSEQERDPNNDQHWQAYLAALERNGLSEWQVSDQLIYDRQMNQ